MQKSVVFFYTSNKQSEKEIKEMIPFAITIKRIKYLGISLTKEPLRLIHWKLQYVPERYLRKSNKWKDVSCSRIGELNILR